LPPLYGEGWGEVLVAGAAPLQCAMVNKSLSQVLDQLQKLKRHAASALKLGSIEEANAFAHRVTVLLEKYRLEESDIDLSEVSDEPAIGQQVADWDGYGLKPACRRCVWLEELVGVVAENNGTAFLILPGSNIITLVGKPAQRAATEYIVGNLIRFMSTAVETDFRDAKKYVKHGSVTKDYLQGYRKAWRQGFIQAVAYRYQQRELAGEVENSTALALLKSDYDKAYETLAQAPARALNNARSVNEIALHDGFRKASEANIDANGMGEGAVLSEIQA
jgi:hypothetical protein